MPLAPISQNSLTDHCYQRIKEAILQLDLRPGVPLVESRLAAELGTSKSPVREALLRLTADNLVLPSPGRSSIVAGISMQDIRNWYELRSILEPASLEVVGPLMDRTALAALEERNAEAAAGLAHENVSAYVRANESFHLQLVRLNPNKTLGRFVEHVLEQIRRVRVALYELDYEEQRLAGVHGGTERHGLIIRHLMDRDTRAAQEVLREDITLFLDRLELPEVQDALQATQLIPEPAMTPLGSR